MSDYLTIVVLIALAGLGEWRLRQVEKWLRLVGPSPEPKPLTSAEMRETVLFPCYYCSHLYPLSQRERIGTYDYCLAHGSKRKAEQLAIYTKETAHDRTVRLYPADSRSELSDNDKLPWVG